jgi:hypothetical protein
MTENLILMIMGIPSAGFSFAHHFNKFIDLKPHLIIEAKVVDFNYLKYKRKSKYGYAEGYDYFMIIELNEATKNFNIPKKMKVSRKAYIALKKNAPIEITIAQGGLNHPWLKNIRFKRP